MSTIEQAIRKATRLLKLSQSDNVHEASVAASKAQGIIDEFKLDPQQLEMAEANEEPEEPIMDFTGKAPLETFDLRGSLVWKYRMALSISGANQCLVYQNSLARPKRLEIVGRPSDVETVRYLYAFLTKEIDRLCNKEGKGCGNKWRNNFKLGAVTELATRLRSQREKTVADIRGRYSDNPRALVRIDNQIVKMEKHREEVKDYAYEKQGLVEQTIKDNSYQESAREAGKRAAKGIVLSSAKASIGAGK